MPDLDEFGGMGEEAVRRGGPEEFIEKFPARVVLDQEKDGFALFKVSGCNRGDFSELVTCFFDREEDNFGVHDFVGGCRVPQETINLKVSSTETSVDLRLSRGAKRT